MVLFCKSHEIPAVTIQTIRSGAETSQKIREGGGGQYTIPEEANFSRLMVRKLSISTKRSTILQCHQQGLWRLPIFWKSNWWWRVFLFRRHTQKLIYRFKVILYCLNFQPSKQNHLRTEQNHHKTEHSFNLNSTHIWIFLRNSSSLILKKWIKKHIITSKYIAALLPTTLSHPSK